MLKLSLTHKKATQECPCGYLNDDRKTCTCNFQQVQKYRSRLSGPLMDRIDLHIEVPSVNYQELKQSSSGEPSAIIRARIEQARAIQIRRFAPRNAKSAAANASPTAGSSAIFCNAHMRAREIKAFCQLDEQASTLLENAMSNLSLSARAYDRILKVSRTIADLARSENIQHEHVAEAIQYRTLDRGN